MRVFGSSVGRLPVRRVRLVLSVLAPALLLVAVPRTAGAQGLETADVAVNIVTAISIQKLQDLEFGYIGVANGGGTMQIRSDGTVITTGSVVEQGGGAHPAEFEVSGIAGLVYNVSMPRRINLSDIGGNRMRVDRFDASNGGSGTLTGGVDTFTVGATLRVRNNQAPGQYRGSIDVTVAYQ